eukprot:NODE_109_length_18665_cov_0.924486.p3 type:complete len:478 gc:universal NODE_109_length_18665_cov_0.924486:6682-8115(+)
METTIPSDSDLVAKYQIVLQNKDSEIAAKDDQITKLNLKINKLNKEMYQLKRKYRSSLSNRSANDENIPMPEYKNNDELVALKEASGALYKDNVQLQNQNDVLKNAILSIDNYLFPKLMDRSNLNEQLTRVDLGIQQKVFEVKQLKNLNQDLLCSKNEDISKTIQTNLQPFIVKHSNLMQENKELQLDLSMAIKQSSFYKKQVSIMDEVLNELEKQMIEKDEVENVQKIIQRESKMKILTEECQSLRKEILNTEFKIECKHSLQLIDHSFLTQAYQIINELNAKILELQSKLNDFGPRLDRLEYLFCKYHLKEQDDNIFAFVGSPAMEHFIASRSILKALCKSNYELLTMLVDKKVEHVPKSILDQKQLEIQDKEQQLATKTKLLNRTKQIFAQKAKQVRDVTCTLLGWSLDLLDNNRFKLSDSGDQYFIFQETEGKFSLVSMDTSKFQLYQPLIESCINQRNSFPEFLATVLINKI